MNVRAVGFVATVAAVATSVAIVAPPVGAAPTSGNLRLSGGVHGAVTVVKAVCNSHVASAKHHFFFDVEGLSGGQPFLLSGRLTSYAGPGTYHTFSGLVRAGNHYFVGHGAGAGSVSIGGGANSARLRVTVKEPAGEGGATATVAGAFTCTAYTSV